jgi:hypothetical protein
MVYLLLKTGITGVIVITISEIAKRSSYFAAILASLPLTSILAFIWMYSDKKDGLAIQQLSYGIFWMVLPSLAFFLLLPAFMKAGLAFYPALILSCMGMVCVYFGYMRLLGVFNIKI